MKYLGVDYGKKYLGLAISDGKLAQAFKLLEVSSVSDACSKVLNVIKEEKVATVIVGLPESGEARALTKKFVSALQKQRVVVEKIDETLTSKNANKLMRELGVGVKKMRHADVTAACLILQEYLGDYGR